MDNQLDAVNLPMHLAQAVADAFHADHPGTTATCVAGRESTPDWQIVFVYWDVPDLAPHPYAVYRVDLRSGTVR